MISKTMLSSSSVATPICLFFLIFPLFSRFFLIFPLFSQFWLIFRCQGWHSAPLDPPVATPLFPTNNVGKKRGGSKVEAEAQWSQRSAQPSLILCVCEWGVIPYCTYESLSHYPISHSSSWFSVSLTCTFRYHNMHIF